MRKRLFIILLSLLLLSIMFASCTDEVGARKALERNLYTDIEIGGYAFFQGANSDVFLTEFTATAPNGERVSGCVTKGWMKGSTIRLND